MLANCVYRVTAHRYWMHVYITLLFVASLFIVVRSLHIEIKSTVSNHKVP